MKKEERKLRIIARGEFSNHSHVMTGDCTITKNDNNEIIVEVGSEGAVLKHILESDWLNGVETWTKEHKDIPLEKGTYKYVAQMEYNPYNKAIEQVRD